MYETDRITSDWLIPATCSVDQLWVPSNLNRRTFAAAGVPESRIRVLHEAVDTGSLFKPARASREDGASVTEPDGMVRHILPPCGVDGGGREGWGGFRILSVFKWERRKGRDVLLRAYWRAFDAQDRVCLYLRT